MTPEPKPAEAVQRFDPIAAYIGTGEYVGDMEASPDGDYVLHSDYESLASELKRAMEERDELAGNYEDARISIQELGERLAESERKRGNAERALSEARSEIEGVRRDAEESDELRAKLADILTRAVNELRGPPPELTAWSWHDIPERIAELKAAHPDAARVNWMEANLTRAGEVRNGRVKLCRVWSIMGELETLRETVDAAIDAARAASGDTKRWNQRCPHDGLNCWQPECDEHYCRDAALSSASGEEGR